MESDTDNESIWERYWIRCPKCRSKDVEGTELFKGHYRAGNPLKKRNQQKYVCKECGNEWWLEI